MLDSLVTDLKNEYNEKHNDEMKNINFSIHDNKTNETAKKTLGALKENLFTKLDLLVKDGLSLVSNVSTITQEENDRTIGNVDRGVDLLAADANEATENIEKFYTIFEEIRGNGTFDDAGFITKLKESNLLIEENSN